MADRFALAYLPAGVTRDDVNAALVHVPIEG